MPRPIFPDCQDCLYFRNTIGRDRHVKNPYPFYYMKQNGLIGKQKRTCGQAILAYRKAWNLSRRELSELVEKYSLQYGVRFTVSDIANYENYNISPKIDKLTALCHATHMPMAFFTGYRKSMAKANPTGVAIAA